MTTSPLCEIKDGSAAYVPAGPGVNVTPGDTIVIRLASQAGVGPWSCSLATADELTTIATINAALVIDSVAKTATFTAPVAGRALRFQSRVNLGKNANNVADDSLTTTFCIYTLAASGSRVHALDETTEGNALAGWGADVNALLRSGGGGGGSLPVTRTVRTTASPSTITTADDLIEVTAAASPQTLPGAPSDGHEYEVCNNTAGNNNVLGNGHNFNVTGNATFTLGPNQSLTATYSSTSAMWLCS